MTQEVFIHVVGGVAEVIEAPEGVDVHIMDFDMHQIMTWTCLDSDIRQGVAHETCQDCGRGASEEDRYFFLVGHDREDFFLGGYEEGKERWRHWRCPR